MSVQIHGEAAMTDFVPRTEIERIVGHARHESHHYARAVSDEHTVYILHSRLCLKRRPDRRKCLFSRALDRGIDAEVWTGHEDKPVRVTINRRGRLIPVAAGMSLAAMGGEG